jgi:hypothetical protein
MSSDDEVLVQGNLWREWKLVITQPDGGARGGESALLKLEERDGDRWNSIWVQLTVDELRDLRKAASHAVVRLTGKVEDLRPEERLLAVAQMAANIRGTAEAMRGCLDSTLRTPAEIVDIMKAVLESTADNMRALADELERKEEDGK